MLKFFSRKQADAQAQLKAVLEGYELPSFPSVYLDALRLVRDTDSSNEKLADVIAGAPGLTANLLRTVNSAAFGLRSQVKSVHHAVSLLGRGHLESMLVTLASHSALPSAPCDGFVPARFWQTAARRAATARALADRVNPAEWSECFTAALLSDMAIPMLCTSKGAPYTRLVESALLGEGELQAMEGEAFGWNHAEVGALMCREWNFPGAIADAIAAHHGSDDPEVRELVPVNLAVRIPEIEAERGVDALVEHAHATLGLNVDDVRGLVEESFRRGDEIADQFT